MCKNELITIPRTMGFSMLAENEEIYDNLEFFKNQQIYDLIKTGTYWKEDSKFMVFNPVIDINFELGCHKAHPTGQVKYDKISALKNLHFSLRGLKHSLAKNKLYRDSASQMNIDLKLGYHRMDDDYFIKTNYFPVKKYMQKIIE
jgi:hypothetical protein